MNTSHNCPLYQAYCTPILNMDRQFLSLSDKDIPDDKIKNEMIPKINVFIKDIYNIKKDVVKSKEDKAKNLQKFKLVMDVIELFQDPNLLKFVKEFKEEQERERKRQEELKKRRESMTTYNSHSIFDNFLNFNAESSSDESERRSDISEDEFEQDGFREMLDREYANIDTHSVLKQRIGITRVYTAEFDAEGSNEDPEKGEGKEAGEKPVTSVLTIPDSKQANGTGEPNPDKPDKELAPATVDVVATTIAKSDPKVGTGTVNSTPSYIN